ncbi:uncharacterized protein KY384_002959 [Bacidia gigantensis]|uniref:uncharacterized protein n=1 Tax=Bacidia gigantensis TaxID=2732470 RepID=UPI001D05BDA1|nr:uncharacterized protein KY384_002959 [Bacidia gigantensis]KAG8531330.1 hypothetical protein KY384_002959 [Bacidia gigantensis]
MASSSRKRSHALVESSSAANQLPAPTSKVQKTTDIRTLFAGKPAVNGLADEAQTTSTHSTASRSSTKKFKKSSSSSATKTSSNPTKKHYLTTIAAIEKKLAVLDKICVKQDPNNKFGVTSDEYAQTMSTFLPAVDELLKLSPSGQATARAFNLLLYMGEHAYADLWLSFRMSGYGESEPEYEKMDKVMIEVIGRLEKDLEDSAVGSKAGGIMAGAAAEKKRWNPDTDADVGEFKTRRPNKQQRGWLLKQRTAWEKERLRQRREKREESEAKALFNLGLTHLKEDRDEIAQYGLKGYFVKSIEKLEKLTGVEKPEARS